MLFLQPIDEEVLEQSGDFNFILKHDIIEWCDMFEDDMEDLMFDKTIEISRKYEIDEKENLFPYFQHFKAEERIGEYSE